MNCFPLLTTSCHKQILSFYPNNKVGFCLWWSLHACPWIQLITGSKCHSGSWMCLKPGPATHNFHRLQIISVLTPSKTNYRSIPRNHPGGIWICVCGRSLVTMFQHRCHWIKKEHLTYTTTSHFHRYHWLYTCENRLYSLLFHCLSDIGHIHEIVCEVWNLCLFAIIHSKLYFIFTRLKAPSLLARS